MHFYEVSMLNSQLPDFFCCLCGISKRILKIRFLLFSIVASTKKNYEKVLSKVGTKYSHCHLKNFQRRLQWPFALTDESSNILVWFDHHNSSSFQLLNLAPKIQFQILTFQVRFAHTVTCISIIESLKLLVICNEIQEEEVNILQAHRCISLKIGYCVQSVYFPKSSLSVFFKVPIYGGNFVFHHCSLRVGVNI